MPTRYVLLAALAAALLSLPAAAQVPFATLSARSMALGGAAVALDDGAATRLVNPAAGSASRVSTATLAGGAGYESGDFRGRRAAGSALHGDGAWGATGLARGVGSAYLARWWSGSSPLPGDLVAQRALELKDWSASAGWEVLDRRFSVGAAVHWMTGRASARDVPAAAADLSNAWDAAADARNGRYREKSRWSWDAGALLTLGPLRVGGVLLNVNEPLFPYADVEVPASAAGGGIRLQRQARLGAAVSFGASVVVAADLDLTKSGTLSAGLSSRDVGGGVEWTTGKVALRAGARWNLEAKDRETTWTGGLGTTLGSSSRLDAGAVYRSGRSAYGGILTLRTGL